MVIIECEPSCRFSANDVVPDLNAARLVCEFLFIHPGVERCTDDASSQTERQPLGGVRKP